MRLERSRPAAPTTTVILVAGALISLAVSAGAASAAEPNAALGCLHQPVKACIASMGRFVTINNDPDIQSPPSKMKYPDGNGRTTDVMAYTFTGRPAGSTGFVVVIPYQGPGGNVAYAHAIATVQPSAGHTEDDYVSGDVYEIVDILLGDKCVGDRPSFYKFMDSQVRPKLGEVKKIHKKHRAQRMDRILAYRFQHSDLQRADDIHTVARMERQGRDI